MRLKEFRCSINALEVYDPPGYSCNLVDHGHYDELLVTWVMHLHKALIHVYTLGTIASRAAYIFRVLVLVLFLFSIPSLDIFVLQSTVHTIHHWLWLRK